MRGTARSGWDTNEILPPRLGRIGLLLKPRHLPMIFDSYSNSALQLANRIVMAAPAIGGSSRDQGSLLGGVATGGLLGGLLGGDE